MLSFSISSSVSPFYVSAISSGTNHSHIYYARGKMEKQNKKYVEGIAKVGFQLCMYKPERQISG